jgi:hypothetical protein
MARGRKILFPSLFTLFLHLELLFCSVALLYSVLEALATQVTLATLAIVDFI